MTLTTSMLVWATLTAALPGGPVHLLERGPRATALAEFVRARGRAAWGAEAFTGQASGARARVLMVDTSSTSVAVEVYGGEDLIASRVLDAEPLELGLLEGWLLVRATLERLEAPGPTPRAIAEAQSGDPAVLADGEEPSGTVTASTSASAVPAPTVPPVASAPSAATAPIVAPPSSAGEAIPPPAREPRALELPEPQLGVGPVEVLAPVAADTAPVRVEVGDEGPSGAGAANDGALRAAPPSPAEAAASPAEPSAADEALATLSALGEAGAQALRVVDAWGVVMATQLAGAPSAGLAVQARKVVGSSVWLTARMGLELSAPLTTVSTTRLPMTAMVGWVPAPELPLELGVQVQLTPLYVSSDDASLEGGLGLGFALGGYGRGTWGVGPVDLFAELALGAPLLRQSYVTSAETASDPVLDFRMALGVEWRWP